MEISEIAENTSRGKTASALITIVLAGFLWVGKTTFEHVGQLAGLQHELETNHQDHAALRGQYDQIVTRLTDRTKSRFTREDADKLVELIREVEAKQETLKEGFLRDFTSLKIELASLESRPSNGVTPTSATSLVSATQVHQLEGQIASLQSEIVRLQHQVALMRSGRGATAPVIASQPELERVTVKKR